MKWLWAYIRRKVMESILAGVHDAFSLGSASAPVGDDEAAKALRAMLGIADSDCDSELAPALPPPSTSETNGSAAQSETLKRGPGRPRKYQEPQG